MAPLIKHLSAYAAYHRDPRNTATHLVGIPMIVLGATVLLARPVLAVGGVPLCPAVAVGLAMLLFYLSLDRRYALAMAIWLSLNVWLATWFSAQSSTLTWLLGGGAFFVLGWVIQLVGHHYEGRKPAFLDNLFGLMVGPLFIAAEVGFALGLRSEVHLAIEQAAGPMRSVNKSAA